MTDKPIKGFNILIVHDDAELEKYKGILGLTEVTNLAEKLESFKTGNSPEAEALTIKDEMMLAGKKASGYFQELAAKGEDQTFYLIPADPDVWTNPAPFDVFVAAMAAVQAPTALRFIANAILVCTEKTHLVRDVEDRWAAKLKAGSIEGNHDLPVRTNDAMTLARAYMTKKLIIGNVEAESVFVVEDVGFRARQDFNIWAAWNAFNQARDLEDFSGELDQWLSDNNLAATFACDDMDDASSPGALAYKSGVQEWNNYPVEKRQDLSFRVEDRLATVAQLEELSKLVPCNLINHKQVMTLASALDDAFEQQDGSHVTLRNIIKTTPVAPKESQGFLYELLNLVNTYRAEEQDVANIARQGYAICPFMQQEDKLGHVYSYGGSANEAGADIVTIIGNVDVVVIARLAEYFLIQLKETEGFDPYVINDAGGATMGNGEPIRLRAIDADAAAVHAAGYYPEPTAGLRLLQILMPDENNILPGEEGYQADKYPQPQFPQFSADKAPVEEAPVQ